jgi:hypothetical protein
MATINKSLTLFTKAATLAVPKTITLHTHGETEAAGEPYGLITLFIAEGMEETGINNSIPLYSEQGDAPSGTLTVHLDAVWPKVESRSIPLFVQHGVGNSGSISLYVKGLGVTTHVQSGLVSSDGFYFHSDSITLMIKRESEAIELTIPLFIDGQQTRTLTGTIPLHTTGDVGGSPYASLTLSLNGGSPTAEMILYTRGY